MSRASDAELPLETAPHVLSTRLHRVPSRPHLSSAPRLSAFGGGTPTALDFDAVLGVGRGGTPSARVAAMDEVAPVATDCRRWAEERLHIGAHAITLAQVAGSRWDFARVAGRLAPNGSQALSTLAHRASQEVSARRDACQCCVQRDYLSDLLERVGDTILGGQEAVAVVRWALAAICAHAHISREQFALLLGPFRLAADWPDFADELAP